ncbi:MAG TPA: serine hydrolase [Candidatus Paceibacterota bacterium]|nr:serine hydrolase [Candidatus Paceibacterota bacterium]
MNSLQKIFFVGVIILSVAIGSRFNGTSFANGNSDASIVVSSSNEKQAAENPPTTETVQPATSNDSTTSNDINVDSQPADSSKTQDETPKTALDNAALLKPDQSAERSAFRRTGSEQPPDIQAHAAIVADLKTGQAYFELNPNLRWPTASLTKLMTASMVLKNMDLSKPVTIGQTLAGDSNSTSTPVPSFFKPGDVYSGTDVLNTMLVISKNEAAEAFANAYGRDNFIAGLNKMAEDLGMNLTHFSDPSGLSVANQSTVDDLEKLALNVYDNYPKILEITRKKHVTITELNSKKKTTLSNINIFAGSSGFIGGKTGYTDEADGNLVSIFSYETRPILVIVLGTGDRFGETSKLFQWFRANYK